MIATREPVSQEPRKPDVRITRPLSHIIHHQVIESDRCVEHDPFPRRNKLIQKMHTEIPCQPKKTSFDKEINFSTTTTSSLRTYCPPQSGQYVFQFHQDSPVVSQATHEEPSISPLHVV